MKYEITRVWNRKWVTESEIPVVTTMIKYVTETGYVGKLELPATLSGEKWIKAAIKKDITNARKICKEVTK